jgi:4-amino-4-deoxy-L-arabinose transferase-like glycosyltransferase
MPEAASPPAGRRLRRFWIVLSIGLMVQGGLGVDAARRWTPTHDEYWHLPYGLYYWQTGHLEADPINPPLVRLWASVPLWFSTVRLNLDGADPTPYAVGDAFLRAAGPHYRGLFFQGRLMMLWWGLAGLVVAALWARAWFGEAAGMAAVVLWAGCPTLLSQAVVVTHDLPLAVATLAALAALARWAQRPTWGRAVVFGAWLGLAQLTKLTAVLLYPLSLVLWFVLPREATPPPRRQLLAMWVVAGVVSWSVLCAGYGFQGVGRADGSELAGDGYARRLLPKAYRMAWRRLAQDLENVHPVFLNGEWRRGGFPLYYVYALGYKLPLGTLAAGVLSLGALCRRNATAATRRRIAALVLAFLAFVVPASVSTNQIGVRYILPAYPCLLLWATHVTAWFDGRSLWRHKGGLVLLLASVPWALRYHPHHLAYFNEWAGGPVGGRQHLVDSNLDWGQDLYALAAELPARTGGEPVSVAYFGSVPPTSAGLSGGPPTPFVPTPGWHAVSVNFVQGRPHTLRLPDGTFHRLDLDVYGYFRFFEPVARIGYSIDVYRLTPEDVARFYAAKAAVAEP